MWKQALLWSMLVGVQPVLAEVMVFGDLDVLGTGSYGTDPRDGAAVEGLVPGGVSFGAPAQNHGFPFSPENDDYPGTDQIYVGQNQSSNHDGYSGYSGRLNGPQLIILDASSMIPANGTVFSLTLGIGADDFQQPSFGQPYIVEINGQAVPEIQNTLNQIDQTGPRVQFIAFGLDPALLDANNVLNLSIDQGGDGGDGWAIDFLTLSVLLDHTADTADLPLTFQLQPAYPNPFNPTTTLEWNLTNTAPARLSVYNLQGRQVALLADGMQQAGRHHSTFDASGLSSGIYLVTLQSAGQRQSRTLTLLK